MLRDVLPFILVLLAVFAAGCIGFIAWELSSEDRKPPDHPDDAGDEAGDPGSN